MLADMKIDEEFSRRVGDVVAHVEERTDAELVVAVSGRAGDYRDLRLLIGAVAASAALAIAVYGPWVVSPSLLLFELWITAALAAWGIPVRPWLLRRVTSAQRRRAIAERAAAEAFFDERVHATRGRTGVLVFLARDEGEVVLLTDHGVDAAVPRGAWNNVQWDGLSLDGFLASLAEAGAVLAHYVPARDGDNPDELSNAPRIRS